MQKLIAGIAEFRRKTRPAYRAKFAKLALGQAPDCLFFACSDSRVVPNLFASTEPGDLFVVRNVGDLVPPYDPGSDVVDGSAGAAVEFALNALAVRDIVVCGHSECGAMRALCSGSLPAESPTLQRWLDTGRSSLARVGAGEVEGNLSEHDRLSQVSVLQQLDNLRTYPAVRGRIESGAMTLHAWWFDLARAEVLVHDPAARRFVPLAEDAEGP